MILLSRGGKGIRAMMGDRLVMQESLFYEFCLDEFVPSNHMLRAIGQFVDLSDLRRHLGLFYSSTGRLDPELMPCSSTSQFREEAEP